MCSEAEMAARNVNLESIGEAEKHGSKYNRDRINRIMEGLEKFKSTKKLRRKRTHKIF